LQKSDSLFQFRRIACEGSQLTELCSRFDAFEKKAIRWIAIGTSLPGVIVGVVAVLKFFGRL